ncbi:MAG: hypothetical protein HY716_06965 [Planctomycetes bacterium]|nr:hypothetical protein [Planctomycetota bacterium]
MTPQERKGYLVLAALAVVVGLVAIALYAGMSRRNRIDACIFNLMRVGMAVQSVPPGQTQEWDQIGTGRGFFEDYASWPSRTSFPIEPHLFRCPVRARARSETGDVIDYRGPVRSLRRFEKDEVIAADRIGNHGSGDGGVVLLRDGQVFEARKDDAAWTQATSTTSD